MAEQHLTSLSSPTFPHVFPKAIDRFVDRVLAIYEQSLAELNRKKATR